MAAEGEPGGSGLVDIADLRAVLGETLVELVESSGVSRDIAVGTWFLGGVRNGDGDSFSVDIEADVLDVFGCG